MSIQKREMLYMIYFRETKVEWQSKPLEGITLCLDVKMDVPTKTLTSKIKDLGGHVSSHVEKNTAALVSTPGLCYYGGLQNFLLR